MLNSNYPIYKLFVNPRKTIRNLLDEKVYPNIFIFCILYSLLYSFRDNYERMVLHTATIKTYGQSFLVMIVASIISITIMGYILKYIGLQFGGKGTADEVRSAFLWGVVPQLISLLIVLLIFLFIYIDRGLNWIVFSPIFGIQLVLINNIIMRIGSVIGYFYIIIALVEAHKYSFIKSLFTFLLASILLALIIIFVFIIMQMMTSIL